MALLSELVSVVAEVEGLDPVSVGIFARHAREAGHISQGGRGRAAAKMNVRDAANLLIAVNACALAKDIAEAVPLYRELRISEHARDNEVSVSVCRPGASFGEDLERVIAMCGDPEERSRLADLPAQVVVEFHRPQLRARIGINLLDEEGTIVPIGGQYGGFYPKRISAGGDRSDQTVISQVTLIAVAEALRS